MNRSATEARAPDATALTAPFRQPVFRRIWLASLFSNLGALIQGVGAAWAMTQLTTAADMVALVQTASMLPAMLACIPAGAVADMYDRRIIALVGLGTAFTGAGLLTALSLLGLVTPAVLLVFCFVIGLGMALFGPAWQASVSEQVPIETLPSAVALNSISYNLARSFGPAIGGVIVAAAGSVAAFGANTLLYIPLLLVLFTWRRKVEPSRLPPERLGRAIVSGVRYIVHSPPMRVVLARATLTVAIGSAISAMMPLIARDLLKGDARTYGLILGAFGVGAVVGALNVARIRHRFSSETAVRACTILLGLAVIGVSFSRSPLLTAAILVVGGAVWTLTISLCNIAIQLAAPRWVTGRALAAFQTGIAGGIAIGSWIWGRTADGTTVHTALLIAGLAMLVSPLLGLWLRMPGAGEANDAAIDVLADPEIKLALTGRSGPIVVEIDYVVDPASARAFYGVMQDVQLSRQRNGAYGWSIARDIADPALWTERFECPTWHDYLRQRNRATQAERLLHQKAQTFHTGPDPVRVRRMLERPFGSVRWKEEVADPGRDLLLSGSGS